MPPWQTPPQGTPAGSAGPVGDRAGAGRLSVLPIGGTYVITTDFSSLGFGGGDVAFCRHITAKAGVTAIPVSTLYNVADAPGHYARFAFWNREEALTEAIYRLQRHFGA